MLSTQQIIDCQRWWASLPSRLRTSAQLDALAVRVGITADEAAEIIGAQACRTMCMQKDAERAFARDRRDGSPEPADERWRR